MAKYDFSGYATKNDLLCSDGRTIRRDAFKGNDGQVVPLVWQHQHGDPQNILGHALLENRDDGVYAYGVFNDTEAGQNAKMLVNHGDITALSIYANRLKQHGGDVVHGVIREVSLVLAGANTGAVIDNLSVSHSDEPLDDEAIIYTGENFTLAHSDSKKKDEEIEEDAIDEESKKKTITHSKEEATETPVESKGDNMANEGKTVKEVFDTLNEEQKTVVYALIGQAIEDAKGGSDDDDEEMEHGGFGMKYNVFDGEGMMYGEDTLSHAEVEAILADGKRYGSLKDSFLAHAEEYGIENIDYLFPEAQTITNTPEYISRDMDWVKKVMSGVHHTPFSRIKSVFADITEDEARAKGYIKGKLKKEEVFTLLKRSTTPTTIYKKQKLDRDDVIDITDFDVVAWLKSEMRTMLDEEIARAILVGDGRSNSDDDKINEMNIRPVYSDADLYSVKVPVTVAANATDDDKAKAFIRAAIKARKDYKGTGTPVLFTTEDMLTNMLLLTDTTGHDLYDSEAKLATKLRVKEIVVVPVLENVSRNADGAQLDLAGIIVNLDDYNVGADKGGAVNMFDDFDIDYNQQKYLIETRCSGALTKPYSALVMEFKKQG